MIGLLRKLLHSTNGASAAEYALVLTIIGVGIAGASFALGESIAGAFGDTGNDITTCGGTC